MQSPEENANGSPLQAEAVTIKPLRLSFSTTNKIKWNMEYLTRSFLLTLAAVFVFLIISLAITASNVYSMATAEEANQTLTQIQTERQTLTVQKIFLNNLLISIPLIIPIVGLIPFTLTWINTGTVIGLLAKATGIPPIIYVSNITILAFPEILAYSLLIAENILVSVLTLFKAGAKTRLITQSWKTLILYITLLFIGAVVEMSLIG